VSLLSVVHAALLVVLHRYTGQTDLAVGSVFGGRTRAESELLVANLANTLVLRTRLDGDPTFDELVARCHGTVVAAAARQEVPFGLVVDALQPERVAGRSPLYTVSLTLQPRSAAIGGPALGAVTSELLDVAADYLPTDVNLVVEEGGAGVVDLHVGYSPDLFDHDRVERLLRHVVTALDGGLARPDRAAADIDVMPAAERSQVLVDAIDTAVVRPYRPLHRIVEDVAAARPDALAVLDHDGTEHTYRRLDACAERLARRLRRHGAGPGVAVGVCLPRGIDLVTTLLAVWKAGAAFVPLEPDLPPARLAALLVDAAPPVVVADAAHADRFGVPVVVPGAEEPSAEVPDDGPQPGDPLPGDPEPGDPEPGDLAYLLHTSGSTGEPKGVRVPHRGVHNRIAWMQDAHPIGPGDRVLQKTPYGFDVAVWEFFWPLTTGAAIVVTAPDGHRDPHHLHRVIADRGVTTAHFVPTMLGRFLDAVAAPLPGLRRVFCSGEALPLDTAQRFLSTWPDVELHNLYGPTEASIDVTAWRCLPGAASVPIGTPIANTRAHVLDARLRPAPVGIPGELYLAGTGLAEGYHRQPGLTATRFVADPYGDRPGGRLYATGDLARRRADGVLEYLGRTDRQVKLRGHRIEPGEIEHAITRHPGVRQCAVVLRHDGPGGEHPAAYLAAYLVGDADPAEIRKHLAGRLPTPMLPTAYVVLPELPVTHSGKLDAARLPEPPRAEARYAPPGTDTERWLADTWRDLLGVARVGTQDDFFDLGANSLHTTQLTARIRDHLSIDLAPHHLFTSPTLELLAALLDETAPLVADDPIVPVPRDGPLPCTVAQEGLWFVQQLDPASTAYYIGFGTRLLGELDVPALERALHALVVRHEALRTRFVAVDGVPRQVVDDPPAAVPLPVGDVPAERVEEWTTAEIRRPLDLAAGPTFRAALARVAPEEHVLALAVHHIVADGWSARILTEELSRLYGAETTGTPAALPTLAVQPADHAAWQRRTLTDAELESRLDHWRTALADLPTVDLPTDRPRPAHPTGAGRTVSRRLPDGLAAAARDYARTRHVSFLGLLQSAVLIVLNRYTGQDDLPIGSIFSGRTRAETEPLVGYFVNAAVLRTRVDGDPTFAQLVRRCHDTVLHATAHQDVPFGEVVDALRPERVEGRNPLFQVGLSLLPAKGGERPRLGALVAEPVRADTGRARFDIGIDVEDEAGGGLSLSVEHSTELFDTDRIERLVDHLTAALAGGLAEPDAPADDIDILSAAERQQLLGGPPTGRAAPADEG
jgi:amino acid adenylation domain-containing protein